MSFTCVITLYIQIDAKSQHIWVMFSLVHYYTFILQTDPGNQVITTTILVNNPNADGTCHNLDIEMIEVDKILLLIHVAVLTIWLVGTLTKHYWVWCRSY